MRELLKWHRVRQTAQKRDAHVLDLTQAVELGNHR
jgi:hypothetical protein